MSDKNTKDDDDSKEETGGQKENKNLNMLKKYALITWAELGSIFTDIKNASQKIAEEKDATKEIVAVEGLHSQEKSSASEFFKKQIIDLKKFWNYMNKKSKIFIIIGKLLLFIVVFRTVIYGFDYFGVVFAIWQAILFIIVFPIIVNIILSKFNLQKEDIRVYMK
jgi:hypothetical protein